MQPSLASISRLGVRAIALALAFGLPVAVLAQPKEGPPNEGGQSSSWSLGLGAASMQKAYRGMDRETKLLPMIRYENKYVRISGLGGEVKLPGLRLSDAQQINFSLLGKMEMAGYEADDSPFLAGMAERKGGFWAGARAEWENPWATVTAELRGDASGDSKGRAFTLGLKRNWRLGQNFILTPSLAATHYNDKYVDYYYGVRASEVRPGRAAYRGDAGTNVEVALRGMYMIDRHHSIIMSLGATRLASEMRKSPLVDRSSENTLLLGYSYRF